MASGDRSSRRCTDRAPNTDSEITTQAKGCQKSDKNYTYFNVLRHNIYVSSIHFPSLKVSIIMETQIHSSAGCSLLFKADCLLLLYHRLRPEHPPPILK